MKSALYYFSITLLLTSTIFSRGHQIGLIMRNETGNFARFYLIGVGLKLDTSVLQDLITTTNFQCFIHCIENNDCVAMNMAWISSTQLRCQLLPMDQQMHPSGLTKARQWSYYDTRQAPGNSSNVPPTQKGTKCGFPNSFNNCSYYHSCKEALSDGFPVNRSVKIKLPSMEVPLIVKCQHVMNKYIYVFEHNNSETTTVSGFESPGSYRKKFIYKDKVEDIITAVDKALSCKQHTSFKCVKSGLSCKDGWLEDRYGKPMTYFGGGPHNGKGCACGVAKTCVSSAVLCNCDAELDKEVADEGFVKHKQHLPLTSVSLGDTGDSDERIKYTIGPLLCKFKK